MNGHAIKISLPIVAFLILWEIIGRAEVFSPPHFFPPLSQVLEAMWEWQMGREIGGKLVGKGNLVRDLHSSLSRAGGGFILGSSAAILTGMVTGRIHWINKSLAPLIQLFRPVPPVALIPLVIVWFGIGEMSKVLSISYAVFFPVWINTHIGAQEIAKSFLWSARSLKVRGISILWKVIFPGALPFIIAGLRTGAAMAILMVFVAEQTGASEGLGYRIWNSNLDYRIDLMIAGLFLLGLMGATADFLLTKSMTGVFPWLNFVKQK